MLFVNQNKIILQIILQQDGESLNALSYLVVNIIHIFDCILNVFGFLAFDTLS